jgi:hypothetical protein
MPIKEVYWRNPERCKKEKRRWYQKYKQRERDKENNRYATNPKLRRYKIRIFHRWRKRNKDRHSKDVLKNYYLNKSKWSSRSKTLRIVNSNKYPTILKERLCKLCGGIDNIEIHHECYPIIKIDIIKAILDGKIYFLCQNCHKKLKSSKIFKRI